MKAPVIRIGTAGWSIPRHERASFPPGTGRLAEYSRVFSCVELNTTFYRPHRATTYERWAATVPAGFRFSLKIPKQITHERRLRDCEALLKDFVRETAGLGEARDVLLLQLPPSFAFEEALVARFLTALRETYAGRIACEPRHASWFEAAAEALLRSHDVARVAADPAVVPAAARPGGARAFAYYRWHGAPRTYYSAYDSERVATFAEAIDHEGTDAWCIFDNTALGAATTNALELGALLQTRLARRVGACMRG